MKILHSAALLSPPSGIVAQMNWEQDAANDLGIDWIVRLYCPLNSVKESNILQYDTCIDSSEIHTHKDKFLAWIKLRHNYHKWLLEQEDKIDIFLLRYYVHDPFQLAFVKRCKKPVYLVHHALEVPELALPGTFLSFVRAKLEALIGRSTISQATGLIGVTQEIVDFEIKRIRNKNKFTHVYPNGVILNKVKIEDCRSASIPEFLFVANFAPWHGLDIILNDISASKKNFILHLVGDVPKELIPFTKDGRIIIHGRLTHDEIMRLSQQCWVGLSSFAQIRTHMKQTCSLKSREYLSWGLPVYGDSIDVFPSNSPFYCIGPSTIDGIFNFAINTRNLNKLSIASSASKWIDKKILLSKLNLFLLK